MTVFVTLHIFFNISTNKRNYIWGIRSKWPTQKQHLNLINMGKGKNCPCYQGFEPLTQNSITHYFNKSVTQSGVASCRVMSRRVAGFGICLPVGHSWQWPKVTSKLIKNVPARHLSICHNMPLYAIHFTMQWLSPFKALSFAWSVYFRLEKYLSPFDSSYPKHSNSGNTGEKKHIPTFVYI